MPSKGTNKSIDRSKSYGIFSTQIVVVYVLWFMVYGIGVL
jgi:hypothetical protein